MAVQTPLIFPNSVTKPAATRLALAPASYLTATDLASTDASQCDLLRPVLLLKRSAADLTVGLVVFQSISFDTFVVFFQAQRLCFRTAYLSPAPGHRLE